MSFVSSQPRVTVALLFAVLVPFGAPAAAVDHAPISCLNTERGAILGIEGPQSSSAFATMRGHRSDLLVTAGTAQCQRISSVYVQTIQGGWYEFGWVLGWSNCDQGWHSSPTAFAWWVRNNGTHGCRVFSNTPSTGNNHEFRSSDVDGNFYWGAWLDGNELQTAGVHMDFNQGVGAVGMERGDAADSGYTKFINMQEYHDGNGWTNWDGLEPNVDTDPDYHLQVNSSNSGITTQ